MSVQDFIEANRKSPAVSGVLRGGKAGGVVYTLANGTTHEVSAQDSLALPKGIPVWKNGKENLI